MINITLSSGVSATPLPMPSTKRAIMGSPTWVGSKALGTDKDVATKRPSKWQLQRMSARLLPGWSVNECMHKVVEGASSVSGIYVPSTGSGVLAGVKRCRSAWVCPICATQITERRRQELHEALKLWREKFNGRVVMCTYTFRHNDRMPLKWMVARLNEAFRDMKKPGAYKRLMKACGMRGTVATREAKYSRKNGFHPHIHELIFIAGNADIGRLEVELREMWETAAAKCGLSMNHHGFKLDDCDQRIVDYILKYGHEPAWTEAEELSKWHLKQHSRKTDEDEEHYTPFQLLRFAYEGDEEAGALFVEYAEAFYGRSQIRWKTGFREFLGLAKEKTDDECIEEHEEFGQVMVTLDAVTEWPVIVGNDAVGEFVTVLATGDMLRICEFLALFDIMRDSNVEPTIIDLQEAKKKKLRKKQELKERAAAKAA